MNVKKMAMTSALALAAGIAVAPLATAYPALDLPTLLMLRFYTVPTTGPCSEGECKSPANDHPDGPEAVARFQALNGK
jgi:hypothetical protein